jgi:hypothetical protein
MALQARTNELRKVVRDRVGDDAFDAYLSGLAVVETSSDRVVLEVDATLGREAARRYGHDLAAASRQLLGSRRILLAGEGEVFDLEGGGQASARTDRDDRSSRGRAPGRPARLRQRAGPCGQLGVRQRLEAQQSFRVPFAAAASLPRTASQAFGRQGPDDPLRYVGRWGEAYSEASLTPFHHRLLLGALRLAQAGCLTEHGIACSVNSLLLAAEGKGSRELPVAREQVLPALMELLVANACHTAHHVSEHSGEPYIAERRKLDQPVLQAIVVRTAEAPDRLTPLSEVMARDEDGRFQQTVQLAPGGGASMLISFSDWVLEALAAPSDQVGTRFVLLDAGAFLRVRSRRLFTWLAVRTAPAIDSKTTLPADVPRAPQNTVYKRIDLNHVSVRDFGRHGQDLDRVCEDIREDLCGEHGLTEIDTRIHSARALWSGGVLQLWICWRTGRELPHRGELPRRLAARCRRCRRGERSAPDGGRPGHSSLRQSIPSSPIAPRPRGVPRIVQLARSQMSSSDDGDA